MTRDEAIQQFTDSADLEAKARAVLAKVLERNPSALMIVWEEGTEIRAATVPFSHMLARGMVETLYGVASMAWGPPAPVEEEEDEVE